MTGRNSAATALTVARLFQSISDCTEPIIVFVVSPRSCFVLRFRLYCVVAGDTPWAAAFIAAGDIVAIAQFILVGPPQVNCVGQQLRLTLPLIPDLLASFLADQHPHATSSSSEPVEAPPQPTSPWPGRFRTSPPSPSPQT